MADPPDKADTDPGGPPALETGTWLSGDHRSRHADAITEVDPIRSFDSEDAPLGAAVTTHEPDALRVPVWGTESLEARKPTAADDRREKELARRLWTGLEWSRLARRRREELVESAESRGRDFVAYSAVAKPAARTELAGTAEALTIEIRRGRRKFSWWPLAAMVMALGVFGLTRMKPGTAMQPAAPMAPIGAVPVGTGRAYEVTAGPSNGMLPRDDGQRTEGRARATPEKGPSFSQAPVHVSESRAVSPASMLRSSTPAASGSAGRAAYLTELW